MTFSTPFVPFLLEPPPLHIPQNCSLVGPFT